MTDSDERDALGTRVASRLLERLDDLVERMGATYRDEVPEYAALPATQMADEVLPVSEAIVESFFRAVARGDEPTVSDVPFLRSMGRRRLEMGVPLEPMLHVYRVAGRVVWDAVVDATEAGEEHVLATLGAAWMDFIDQASSVAASGYLEASHERLRRVDARRGALLEALLGAVDDSDIAAVGTEFSVAVASTYVPVVAAGPEVTTRIDRMAEACETGTITGFRANHVLLLVPSRIPDVRPPLSQVADAGRATVVCHGRPTPPGPLLATEVGATDALVSAALDHGRHGVFGPDDLLVERILGGDRRAAERLRVQLRDAVGGADRTGMLSETLRAYLASGSIPDTARTVSVHPNTVSYRLRRITDITGLDPRVPNEAVSLALAFWGSAVTNP